jgi:hypothetical protein
MDSTGLAYRSWRSERRKSRMTGGERSCRADRSDSRSPIRTTVRSPRSRAENSNTSAAATTSTGALVMIVKKCLQRQRRSTEPFRSRMASHEDQIAINERITQRESGLTQCQGGPTKQQERFRQGGKRGRTARDRC